VQETVPIRSLTDVNLAREDRDESPEDIPSFSQRSLCRVMRHLGRRPEERYESRNRLPGRNKLAEDERVQADAFGNLVACSQRGTRTERPDIGDEVVRLQEPGATSTACPVMSE
jgi:hypothetical protein